MGSVVSPRGGFRNWDRPVLALVVSNRSCWQTGLFVGGPGGAFQSPCSIIASSSSFRRSRSSPPGASCSGNPSRFYGSPFCVADLVSVEPIPGMPIVLVSVICHAELIHLGISLTAKYPRSSIIPAQTMSLFFTAFDTHAVTLVIFPAI